MWCKSIWKTFRCSRFHPFPKYLEPKTYDFLHQPFGAKSSRSKSSPVARRCWKPKRVASKVRSSSGHRCRGKSCRGQSFRWASLFASGHFWKANWKSWPIHGQFMVDLPNSIQCHYLDPTRFNLYSTCSPGACYAWKNRLKPCKNQLNPWPTQWKLWKNRWTLWVNQWTPWKNRWTVQMANFSSKFSKVQVFAQNVANSKEKCPRLKNEKTFPKKQKQIWKKIFTLLPSAEDLCFRWRLR